MDQKLTGNTIRRLRKEKGLTQAKLAQMIGVSSKAVSKWETAKGLPDISMLLPLSRALGVSVMEFVEGNAVINRNVSANLMRSKFYVCPVCGNIIHAAGEAAVSCCGIMAEALTAKEPDAEHELCIEAVEDEHFVTVKHDMTKQHYISFMAFVTGDRLQMVKLYPEGNAETRFSLRGRGFLYFYCNQHGLMKVRR